MYHEGLMIIGKQCLMIQCTIPPRIGLVLVVVTKALNRPVCVWNVRFTGFSPQPLLMDKSYNPQVSNDFKCSFWPGVFGALSSDFRDGNLRGIFCLDTAQKNVFVMGCQCTQPKRLCSQWKLCKWLAIQAPSPCMNFGSEVIIVKCYVWIRLLICFAMVFF